MRRAFTFLGLATAILLFITGMLHFLFKFTPAYPVQKLEKGWIVIYHNEQYVNTNLEHLSTLLDATFAKGDTITLNLEKPIDYSGLPFPYLVLKTPYCGYQIFIDGKLIAEKNTNNDFKDVFVGITYNPIALPLEMSGGKLSIKLFVSENNTHVDIVTPIIGNYEDVYRQILHAALYPAFTGIFMIIFGIIFLIISKFS